MNDIPAELQISPDLSTPLLVAAAVTALLVILLSWRARGQYLALPQLGATPPAGELPTFSLVTPGGPGPDEAADWFVFLHPSAQAAPPLLSALTAYAAARSLDAAAILPPPPQSGLAARALAPVASAIHFSGVSAARLNDPRHPMALLPPACLILRPSVCVFFGGPRTVARAFADPPSLARRFKHHRVAYRLVRSAALVCPQPPSTRAFILSSPVAGTLLAFAATVSFCWLPLVAALLYNGLWHEAALFALLPVAAFLPWYPSWPAALLAPAGLVLFHLTTLPRLLAASFARPKEPAPGS